ncbi:MAG: hypothetical protein WC441_02765 [Patescibacteria group bacterium]
MAPTNIIVKLSAQDKLKVLKKLKRESSLSAAVKLQGKTQASAKAYKRRSKHKPDWPSDF